MQKVLQSVHQVIHHCETKRMGHEKMKNYQIREKKFLIKYKRNIAFKRYTTPILQKTSVR